MTSSLRVEVRSDAAALGDLAEHWRRLWSAQPRREIFTSWDWSVAYWHAAPKAKTLSIVVVRRGDRVVGLLPLVADGNGRAFLSGPHADYNDMLVEDADPAGVVAAALQACGPCTLDSLPEWSTLCRSLSRLPESLRARISVAFSTPCPALRLQGADDGLLKEMASKKSLKRHEKKLQRHGKVELHHLAERGQIRQALQEFFVQHITRRALAGQRSLFLDETPRRFYAELVDRLDPGSELRFARLTANGVAVAYHFGFELDGRYTWYKPSFDVNYWDCGVGEVLLKRLLEAMPERRAVEFDFTRGDEAFKHRFANHRGCNVHWTLCDSAAGAQLQRAKTAIWETLKKQRAPLAVRDRLRLAMAPLATQVGQRAPSRLRQLLLRRDRRWLLAAPAQEIVGSAAVRKAIRVERVSLRDAALISAKAGLRLASMPRWRALHSDEDRLYAYRHRQDAPVVARLSIGLRVDAGFDRPHHEGASGEEDTMRAAAPAGRTGADLDEGNNSRGSRNALPLLDEPQWTIEFADGGWPAPDELIDLIAEMLADAGASGVVWIACPSIADSALKRLTDAGFVRRWHCVQSQWLGGEPELRYESVSGG